MLSVLTVGMAIFTDKQIFCVSMAIKCRLAVRTLDGIAIGNSWWQNCFHWQRRVYFISTGLLCRRCFHFRINTFSQLWLTHKHHSWLHKFTSLKGRLGIAKKCIYDLLRFTQKEVTDGAIQHFNHCHSFSSHQHTRTIFISKQVKTICIALESHAD